MDKEKFELFFNKEKEQLVMEGMVRETLGYIWFLFCFVVSIGRQYYALPHYN